MFRMALSMVVAVCLAGLHGVARGQSTVYVTNTNATGSGSMLEALNAATLYPGPFTIEIAPGLTLTPQSMYFVAATGSSTGSITINGNGATINMSAANGGLGDRAFFIASGTVAINNLSIVNGRAVGGNGVDGGGGGAGLGGAIFIANPQALTGPNLPTSPFTFPTSVTLTNVSIASSQAVGGNSLAQYVENMGGGGGMGGNGGFSAKVVLDEGGGGGGGFGVGANGGNSGDPASNGAIGSFANSILTGSGAALAAGNGGMDNTQNPGGTGGPFGGGGGGAKTAFSNSSGGGGGVGGGNGVNLFWQLGPGGAGGFGGGGGGSGVYAGGNGGFGGGGGGNFGTNYELSGGGVGGFGGGGGGSTLTGGGGGFGAGSGNGGGGSTSFSWQGGGGLGAGGGIFVMQGASLSVVYDAFSSGSATFTGNSVTSGTTGFQAGSAYGADLFLGANVTFNVAANRTLSVNSLGGAGNLLDANVSGNANDPNAQGGIVKTGSGTLVLTGSSYYTGPTIVNSGSLVLSGTALEQGTQLVIVGQNSGDVATLQLLSSSTINLGGFAGAGGNDSPLVIAQNAGSTGQVVIGSGPGSNGAAIGARVFTGGSGTASVVFTQQYAVEPGINPYPFYTTLTGSLGIVQAGIGTTSLQPLYGPNTFTGPVTVTSGTLATTGTVAAMANVHEISVLSGAVLLLGQLEGVNQNAHLTLVGGVLQMGMNTQQEFGPLSVTGSNTSVIDFLGTSPGLLSALALSSLDLASGSALEIWNYSNATEIAVPYITGTSDFANVRFYSDSGSTFLGYGGIADKQLVPVAVPEPATWAMALAGLAAGLFFRRRRSSCRGRSLVVMGCLVAVALGTARPAHAQPRAGACRMPTRWPWLCRARSTTTSPIRVCSTRSRSRAASRARANGS